MHYIFIAPRLFLTVLLCLALNIITAQLAECKPMGESLEKSPLENFSDSLKRKIDSLNIPGLTITDVQLRPAGTYTPLATGKEIPDLPAFCLVSATIRPTPQSEIKIEIWMPQNNWNGRLLGTGNGGGAGSIIYDSLKGGLRKGFATAQTDMGTSRGGANGAVGKPEIWADFGYRATHLMTVVAKAVVQAYYGKPAHHSYFIGCSTGGQQALMEAQRFPDDYNGIVAGAPANNRTHLHTGFLFNYRLTNRNNKPIFTREELNFVGQKIALAYAEQSGGAPGDDFLTDPGVIKLNFDTLFKCRMGSKENCLNDEQISALKEIYKGPVNPRTHEQIYTSPPVGSENVSGGISSQQTEGGANGLLYPFKWVFGNGFDVHKFDFDHDLAKVDSILGPLLNANNPDLNPMKRLGGKIIMYTGTADPLVPYQDAVNYYDRVVSKQKSLKATQDFFRCYLIPGMGHCSGGPGLNGFSDDILNYIVNWVEKGTAPDKIMAKALNCCVANGPPRLQRPVFPYPLFPKYTGGDVNSPNSYIGVQHATSRILKPAKRYLK